MSEEKPNYRDLLLDHASEQLDTGQWYVPREGAREESQVQPRSSYRWPSEAAALRELIESEDDGAASRSTSDPDRFVRIDGGKAKPDGDAAQRKVERLAEVQQARLEAYDGPWQLSDGTEVPVEVCHDVLVWRVCGRRRHKFTRRKTSFYERVGSDPEQIADKLKSEGFDVGARAVVQIEKYGRMRMRQFLRERGLIPGGSGMADDEESIEPIERRYDYEGWSQIAKALGYSTRQAQRYYFQNPKDPLPIRYTPDGRPVARRVDLKAWVRRRDPFADDEGAA